MNMPSSQPIHSFHIPVMGLAYTIDSPIRVAAYGIDSVISIVDDELIEKITGFYCHKFGLPYSPIAKRQCDSRALRITAYLNLVDKLVKQKFDVFCAELGSSRDVLEKFLQMLPKSSILKQGLSGCDNPASTKEFILQHLRPGAIDVNIMTKVDRANYNKDTALPSAFNDAHAALRGFAHSNLNSSVVLSAGMNPSLYAYIAEFPDFFPDKNGWLSKKIILKVSDFRSAMIQGSFLAKKGIWVSEYRIESGLNCGGHAFATDGLLLGPVMEEFRQRKDELIITTYGLLVKALGQKGLDIPGKPLSLRITVQGGVGTAEEHDFFLKHFKADSVGWGSPFLLVPEATSTDPETRNLLAKAKQADFYLSPMSPLGIPFNTVKGTTNDLHRNNRIASHRPGSSCPKKLLALSTEFDEQGLCPASRKYQQIRLDILEKQRRNFSAAAFEENYALITAKSCLCVGLANAAYIEHQIPIKGEAQGVVICPGPNLAYFDHEVSLAEMVGHIYGYGSVLGTVDRPNIFINELSMYIDYLAKEIENAGNTFAAAQLKKWQAFKSNLAAGINYYKDLLATIDYFTQGIEKMQYSLNYYSSQLEMVVIPQILPAY